MLTNNEYHKIWKLNHPERVKEINRDYYLRNKEKINKKTREYYEAHPEKQRGYSKEYYEKNRVSILEKSKTIFAERHRKQAVKDYRRLRMEILNLLGNKCSVCGFLDIRALQIDHVNGGGVKEMKRYCDNRAYYKDILEKIRNGSKDYQLLCANHNVIKKYLNKEGVKYD